MGGGEVWGGVSVSGYNRGHRIVFDGAVWCYELDGRAIDSDPMRPCIRCGRAPTPEGHDACVGHVEGVSAACCGHGVSNAYAVT